MGGSPFPPNGHSFTLAPDGQSCYPKLHSPQGEFGKSPLWVTPSQVPISQNYANIDDAVEGYVPKSFLVAIDLPGWHHRRRSGRRGSKAGRGTSRLWAKVAIDTSQRTYPVALGLDALGCRISSADTDGQITDDLYR